MKISKTNITLSATSGVKIEFPGDYGMCVCVGGRGGVLGIVCQNDFLSLFRNKSYMPVIVKSVLKSLYYLTICFDFKSNLSLSKII